MSDTGYRQDVAVKQRRAVRKPGLLKRFWQSVRTPLAQSTFVANGLVSVIASVLRLTYATNRMVKGSADFDAMYASYAPGIATFWHGQHIMAPCIRPKGANIVALFSRSKDAELNARVAEKFGYATVRGSGGRNTKKNRDKGGASALITLKRALDAGTSVAMIADIPHGTPREAGLGIVMLARFSGRPIFPVAIATSRRKVLESTWDKTTINLPFGRMSLVVGDPIYVAADSSDEELEMRRQQVTAGLNAVTEEAYRLVDGPK